MKLKLFSSVLLSLLFAFAAIAKDSCVECHSILEGNLQQPAVLFKNDIHSSHGFSCASCHGGDPNLDDPQAAMSPARGFRGKIPRLEIPRFCAHCHSDAVLMHKYAPQQRVDQYAQYQTSVHGKRIAAGDTAAATCVDCHSVHDIRAVKDPLAPVYPLRIPETCAKCHANANYMAKYKIPTNQFEEYKKSVHWAALEKQGDLSAPTCASCHGNHGATPPGVASVAAVCGTCHVVQENLYQKSPHEPVFTAMGAAGCVVCHSNHAVLEPSEKFLAGPDAVCAQCHDATSAGGIAAGDMAGLINKLNGALNRSDQILQQASSSGMEVSEAELHLHDGTEALVKARLAVHAFQVSAVQKPVNEGLKVAAETYQSGVNALKERDRRRLGLGVSLVTILITMAGLWLAIRKLEKSPRSGGS